MSVKIVVNVNIRGIPNTVNRNILIVSIFVEPSILYNLNVYTIGIIVYSYHIYMEIYYNERILSDFKYIQCILI